jgi:multiple sugar transport system permease protein
MTKRKSAKAAALFVAPSFIPILAFSILPMFGAFYVSFHRWDLLSPAKWIGLKNFKVLFHDPTFYHSLKNTLIFIAGYLPLVYLLGLGAALLLNRKFKGSSFFRAIYFLPTVTSWVVVALLWKWILNPDGGLVNSALHTIGITGPGWWTSKSWAMVSVILPSAWKDLGLVMLILLAGLQSIPEDLKEAAALDGASKFQIFRHITMPLLTPASFFVLVVSLINNFQVFDQVYLMTGGGPEGSTEVIVQQIFKNSFDYGKMGYASAMSLVLFVIIMSFTLVQVRLQKRWVHYA